MSRETPNVRDNPRRLLRFVIGAKDTFALFFDIAVRLQVVTARPSALRAEIALFAILR
jgi:hypothetical protein